MVMTDGCSGNTCNPLIVRRSLVAQPASLAAALVPGKGAKMVEASGSTLVNQVRALTRSTAHGRSDGSVCDEHFQTKARLILRLHTRVIVKGAETLALQHSHMLKPALSL